MNCSGCGQANEAGMQFCIFCGQSLLEAVKAPSSNVQAAVNDPLLCTVCGKSDPLNGQYCVFCGGHTTSPKNQRPVLPPQEKVSTPIAAPAKKTLPETMLLMFSLLAGILLGLAIAHIAAPWLAEAQMKELWSGHKLVLYTDSPFASLALANKDEQIFLFAMTGPTGTLQIDHLESGSYVMKDSKNLSKENIQINDGQPVVLGYPEFLKL